MISSGLEEIRSAVHRNHRQEEVLHSARHTVKDQLRAAQVPVAVQNAILGHADGSVGESYGTGYPARVLLEAVSKIQYRGLDLTTEAT